MVRLIFKRLLLVQLVVSSIAVLGNTIDSVIVARLLGTNAIAACGLLNPFAILTAAISAVIASGTQIVCSKSLGAGDADGARRQLGGAFVASAAIPAVLVILGYLFMDQFCLLLGADPGTQLFFDTEAYARGLLASCIPSTPIALMMFACVSNGDLKRCRIAGVAIVCLNIVLSIASIVLFHGGLLGVGLATTLATYLVFFYLLGHFKNREAALRPSFVGLRWADFRQIVLIGSPRAAYKVCIFLLILLFNNVLLDFYSQQSVAAYSVVRTINGIVSFSTSALMYCTTLITSTFFGEENRRALHDTVREFTRLGLVMGIVGFALILVFNRGLVLLFLDPGTSTYETACQGLVIIAASLPLSTIAACLHTFFTGTGHQSWGTVLNVVSVLVLVPAAGLLLMPLVGGLFVYIAFPVGYLLELVAVGLFVAARKRQSPLRASSYLFVPQGFGVPSEHELTLEVRDAEGLASCEAQLEKFCQGVGCDGARGLGLEALSLYVTSCLGRGQGRPGEACFVRAYHKDGALGLIVWNTFGLVQPNSVSQVLSHGRELLHRGRLSGGHRDADASHNEAAPKAQDHPDDRIARLDASLAELLEGCEYSLSNPFGLERLRVTIGASRAHGEPQR